MRKSILALCALAAMAAMAVPALAVPLDESSSASQADAVKTRAELREAVALAQATPFDAAKLNGVMKPLMAEPGFALLNGDEQHTAYFLLGIGELYSGDAGGALAASNISISMAAADSEDWSLRFEAAYRAHDDGVAADSLVMLIQRWPEKLADQDDQSILHVANAADTAEGRARESVLLEGLHAHKWRTTDTFWSADNLWLKLVRIRLENGDRPGASAVMGEITDMGATIDVHADKRFDTMIAADPSQYDVAPAVARDLATLQAKAAAAPDKLEGINTVASVLIQFNRAQEALALLDGALARMAGGKKVFSDQDDQINWTMDDRARALDVLGRFDDALAQRAASAKLKENGDVNVSQAINLADDYNGLARPSDALAALSVLGDMSPYGHMALEEARGCAYAQLNDAADLGHSMDYLKAHADDGPQPLLNARLCSGDLDGAAKQVIDTLADPYKRMDILYRLQDFVTPPMAPFDAKMHAAWIALRSRPDVQAAIAKVGRIGNYPVLQQ